MEDLRELLDLLTSHDVRYLIIGAHALALHGFPRATKDLDIWVHGEPENARKLAAALKEFGAAIGDKGAEEFARPERKMIRLGVPPSMIDILNFAGDTDFQEVWEGSLEGNLFGAIVHYPTKTALIEMKRAAGRPQDLADIEKLSG